MTNLTTTDIIDSVLALVQDNSSAARTRILSYINSTLQALAIERNWKFLEKKTAVTLSNGIITTPADFKNMVQIETDNFTLTANDLISAKQTENTYSSPKVTEISGGLQIIPATTGTAYLTYIRTTPFYTDEDVTTLFPRQARPYIERSVLTMFYEYDADDRWSNSLSMTGKMLLALKRWDNSLKTLPQPDSQGMNQ